MTTHISIGKDKTRQKVTDIDFPCKIGEQIAVDNEYLRIDEINWIILENEVIREILLAELKG